jgi:hypothetical protein
MKKILFVLGLTFIATVFVLAQEVDTDSDPGLEHSQLRTFFVKIGTPWGDPSSEHAAIESVEKRLTQKGWSVASESVSDALVVLHGAGQKQTLRAFYEGWPSGYGWHAVGAPALANSESFDYKAGTLVVDIFDRKTKRAVFRGVAQNEIPTASEKNAGNIDKAIKKMFKNLPNESSNSAKHGSQ